MKQYVNTFAWASYNSKSEPSVKTETGRNTEDAMKKKEHHQN
jgi:hypothetical protein